MYLNGSLDIESIYCDFKALEFATCHDYYLKNFTEAGEYTVYLKSRPYKVICDFSKGNLVLVNHFFMQPIKYILHLKGYGITRFNHNKMDIESVTNCDSEDCYKLEITYDHDLELIDLIKENSFECQQTMKVVAYF